MTAKSQEWEDDLLSRAMTGMSNRRPQPPEENISPELVAAYHYCAGMTRQHSRTFYLASGLLPPSQRMSVRALYAFCRVSDEIVDNSRPDAAETPAAALARWRQQVLAGDNTADPVLLAWADTRRRCHIPPLYVEQLLAGVAYDLAPRRYETFADLSDYCYGVACTVGLMSMHIIGFATLEAVPYAVKLGLALQLTNILRDVGEDYRAGRLYLPLSDLRAFGVAEAEIAAGTISDRWRKLMQFQIDRARQFYSEAQPGIALLDEDGRFAIAAAADLYQGILSDIVAHRYDVFRRRAHLSPAAKLRRLPATWWSVQKMGQSRRSQEFGAAL